MWLQTLISLWSPHDVAVKGWYFVRGRSSLLSATVVSESPMRLDVYRRLVFLSLQAVSYGGGLIGDWMGASGTYSLSSVPYDHGYKHR